VCFIVASDIKTPLKRSLLLKYYQAVSKSVRLPTSISAAPTGQIELKFDIGDFYASLSGISKFG
jgi:hypothetical protein